MDPLANLLKLLSITEFGVGSEHWVEITHIDTPHNFYVRPTAYRRYLIKVNSHQGKLLPEEVHPGSDIIYESQLLELYLRGHVLSCNIENGEVSYKVFAYDYGFVENSIPLENLRKPLKPLNIPPLAVRCRLANYITPHGESWTNEAIESMKCYMERREKMTVEGIDGDCLVVGLSYPDDIATMLICGGFAVYDYAHNQINRFAEIEPDKNMFKYIMYNVHDTLTVRVKAGGSLTEFFVSEVNHYEQYAKLRSDLTYFCKTQNVLQPAHVEEGMPVCVWMIEQNHYERALVTAILVPGKKVKVILVDCGKYMQVPFNRLKPMSEYFLTKPVFAIQCSAEESQQWIHRFYDFLNPGNEFKITIVEVGEQFETPHIVKIFHSEQSNYLSNKCFIRQL